MVERRWRVNPYLPGRGTTAMLAVTGSATAAAVALAGRNRHRPRDQPTATTAAARVVAATGLPPLAAPAAPPVDRTTAVRAARRLNRAAGTLAGSVLVDSAMEHYRGAFHNRAMYTPLVTASLSLLVSAHGQADRSEGAHIARDTVYAGTALVGLVGTAFHAFNVGKKPGGFSWQNLFYQAPLGAPAALTLSGLLGFLGERARDNVPGTAPKILGLPAGRAIGAVTGAGIVGTATEAALLHFRGAFHDPFMLLPVTVPPVAGVLCAAAAVGDARQPRPATRWWLRATGILGV
ncbi:MAG: hypothetical protein INR65_19410, partial [Gluconacetobacter diazotrophicus]|nr:hypothetical protein [Gluconacetobacter diazotrophicus]